MFEPREGLEVHDALLRANELLEQSGIRAADDERNAFWIHGKQEVVALLLLYDWLTTRSVRENAEARIIAVYTAQTIREQFASAGDMLYGFAEGVIRKHLAQEATGGRKLMEEAIKIVQLQERYSS